MAIWTRAELRERAQSLADALADDFASEDEWNAWLNAGADELHGLLVRSNETYAETDDSFTTTGVEDIPLPEDFFRATGVDLQVQGTWGDLDRFEWSDRNDLRNVTDSTGAAATYCIRGNTLKMLPVPPAGLTGRINYIPVRAAFEEDEDELDGVNGWEQYVCVWAAIQCKDKGEEDASRLERELGRLEARIRSEAKSRDSAKPAKVRDVYKAAIRPRVFPRRY